MSDFCIYGSQRIDCVVFKPQEKKQNTDYNQQEIQLILFRILFVHGNWDSNLS